MTDLQAYLRRHGYASPARMVIRRGARLLTNIMPRYLAGRVLDIGCGDKSKRHLLDDRVTQYVGLDHEGSLHDKSRVDIFGTAYSIPEPDGSFDGVVCTAVLEHLEEPRAALNETFRVMKRGAYAVFTVPLFWHLHEEPRDFYRYTEHGLRHLFEGAGFSVVELIPASGFWLTVGSMWSYYLHSLPRGPWRHLARLLIMLNNFFFPLLDSIDRRFNSQARRFTWMYLLVARKPE
jgi:SAM-dependent methyltransferase